MTAYRERPVVVAAPMVRALLAGRKTQMRLLVSSGLKWHNRADIDGETSSGDLVRYARYRVGDRLWVREVWSGSQELEGVSPRDWPIDGAVWFWADGNPPSKVWTRPRSPIHMPRWASRLTLIVTDVRVERLQDISRADVLAEGIRRTRPDSGAYIGREEPGRMLVSWPTAIEAYADLWDSINDRDPWAANPWVVVTGIEVQRPALKVESSDGHIRAWRRSR